MVHLFPPREAKCRLYRPKTSPMAAL